MSEHMDDHKAVDENAALRQYTFDVGDLSRDLAYVTVRLDAARAHLVQRDLEHALAAAPDAVVEVPCLGSLRRAADEA
jgi:hypothetical protein